LFEDRAIVAVPGSNDARMKLEWFRRSAARPSNARFGRRDIASLLIMIGIFREFRGAFLVFGRRGDFEVVR
jgi:hypothetical protein